MSNDHTVQSAAGDDESTDLGDRVIPLSKRYDITLNGTQSYLDGLHTTGAVANIQQLINLSRTKLRASPGSASAEKIPTEDMFIDNFICQIARTIGFCVGIDKKVHFDLGCSEALVNLSSEGLLSSIMTIISELRTAVHGQGNIVIKTRYYHDVLNGTEFVNLSIEDDGVWIELDQTSSVSENTTEIDAQTRFDVQSTQKFLEENGIKLLAGSNRGLGTCVTLRIRLTGRTENGLGNEIQYGLMAAQSGWRLQLLARSEEFIREIKIALNVEFDEFSTFSHTTEFSEYNGSHAPDIIIVDQELFSGAKIEEIIPAINSKRGQLIVFTTTAPDPALIQSGVMIMLKPVERDLLKRTISAIKLVRRSSK